MWPKTSSLKPYLCLCNECLELKTNLFSDLTIPQRIFVIWMRWNEGVYATMYLVLCPRSNSSDVLHYFYRMSDTIELIVFNSIFSYYNIQNIYMNYICIYNFIYTNYTSHCHEPLSRFDLVYNELGI